MKFDGHHNGLKTAMLFGVLWALVMGIGLAVSYAMRQSIYMWGALVLSLGMTLYTYWNSATLALRSMKAYQVTPEQAPEIYQIVQELSARAGQPMPSIWMAPTMAPNAFATGRNPQNAAVCVTEGIVQLLDQRELRGVLGHELMHVYNRDILISSVAAAVAGILTAISQQGFSLDRVRTDRARNPLMLILAIVMVFLAPIIAIAVQFAISRTREFDADEDGATLTQDPLALASALKKLQMGTAMRPMEETPQTKRVAAMMIANPFGGGKLRGLMRTHPPMEERIARLEKMAGF